MSVTCSLVEPRYFPWMRTLVTGATGLLGSRLVRRLSSVVVLSRDPDAAWERLRRGQTAGPAAVAARDGDGCGDGCGDGAAGTVGALDWEASVSAYAWDPEAGPPPAAALEGVDAVVHLAGEPLAEGRWTAEKKRRIRDSRVRATRHLVNGLAARTARPKVLVSASAVGYYGERGDEWLDEQSARGEGFLAELCAQWEREAWAAQELGIRVVTLRLGVVLAGEGGALARMRRPFEMGLGGALGSGSQWMPWIHADDAVGIVLHALREPSVRGPINAVAPGSVTNREFVRALGRVLHRPTILRVPAMMLRVVFGEMSQVLTVSQRVLPAAAERSGYVFAFSEITTALLAALDATA